MNPEQETSENFEALQKLLALKRHEQPPPGYFDRLPGRIAMRIERGEGRLNLWEKLVEGYALRPALAYSFALAAFGALSLSVYNSIRVAPAGSGRDLAGNGWGSTLPGETAATRAASNSLHLANWMHNTNPSDATPAMFSTFASPSQSNTLPTSFEAATP